MLTELSIRNFVIIEDLSIHFDRGLNILTGETGAGKSILIDALSGVLGDKMTTDMIRTGYEKATLEGAFDISLLPGVKKILEESGIDYDDETLILRRELYTTGRGRCFANSTHIPISKLQEISEYLVDIHGQNEHQNIARISRHRELLDSFAGLDEDVDRMVRLHGRLSDLKERLKSFEIDQREKLRRIEFNSFAIKEIESANLNPREEVELKNEATLLVNAEKLFTAVSSVQELLNGDGAVIDRLKKTEQVLSSVSVYDTEISNILETIKDALYSLEDASGAIRGYGKNIDFSPERINEVEERRALISSLKKKYGDTVEAVLEFAEKARRELHAITSSDEELERLNNEYRTTVKEAKDLALDLSGRRKAAATDLEKRVMKELADLGMGGTVFQVSIKREINPDGQIEHENNVYVLYPHGLDRIEFLMSANEGEELRELRRVASGGEMSRIMLALKNVILSADIVDTLVFDEVDTGISGKTAEIVGRKLKWLAKDRQVLLITHLAQIAAMSDNHFSVQKGRIGDRITTVVKELTRKDKVREVARLLAGEEITDLSIQHAEEMVGMAESN